MGLERGGGGVRRGALAEVTGGLSAGRKEGVKRCISAAWRKNTSKEAGRMEEGMVMGLRTVGLLGGAGPGRREGAAGWAYPESSASLATCLHSAHTQSGSWCHPVCLKRRRAQGTWPATWQHP